MIKFDFVEKFIPEKEFQEKIKTAQNFWEFEKYAEWICTEFKHKISSFEPFKYIELGSYAGESLYYMSQILTPKSLLVLVDLPTNEVARKILVERTAPWCVKNYGHTIQLVSGDTRAQEVADHVKKYASKYDLCFIDANHEFAFALNDFMRYRDKAEWISFHDISRFNTLKTITKHGVIQANANHLWEAIKALVPQYERHLGMNNDELLTENWLEFIAYDNNPNPQEDWNGIKPRGIGVVRNQGWV